MMKAIIPQGKIFSSETLFGGVMKEKKVESKRIIRAPELCKILGLSYDSVLRLVREKTNFPKPIRVGKRAMGWLESEINAYIDARVAERDKAL